MPKTLDTVKEDINNKFITPNIDLLLDLKTKVRNATTTASLLQALVDYKKEFGLLVDKINTIIDEG
jgi:hypothetical protein